MHDTTPLVHTHALCVCECLHSMSDLAVLQRVLTAFDRQTHRVAGLRTHPHQVTHCLHHGWGRERERQLAVHSGCSTGSCPGKFSNWNQSFFNWIWLWIKPSSWSWSLNSISWYSSQITNIMIYDNINCYILCFCYNCSLFLCLLLSPHY